MELNMFYDEFLGFTFKELGILELLKKSRKYESSSGKSKIAPKGSQKPLNDHTKTSAKPVKT